MGNFSASYIAAILGQLVIHLPTMVVYAIGLAMAVTRAKKYPRAARYSAIGFGILLLLSFASAVLAILPLILTAQQISMVSIGYVLSTVGFASSIIAAIASALLLNAIWQDRA